MILNLPRYQRNLCDFFAKQNDFQYQWTYIFKTKWILIDLIDSQVQLDCFVFGKKQELDFDETTADVKRA